MIREEYGIVSSLSSTSMIDGPQTALTETVESGSVECVRWVLDHGVDLKEPLWDNRLSSTPLDYLFARQLTRSRRTISQRPLPLEIIHLLLDLGVDVKDGRALRSLTQCQYPSEEQDAYTEAAKLLLNHDSPVKKDALHYLIGTNYSCELGNLLVENGADLEDPALGTSGSTPLVRCLGVNHRKGAMFARFLLDSGAKTDLTAKDLIARHKLNPKKFAKWTGVGWDELVATTQGAHGYSNLPPVNLHTAYPRPK